MKSYDISKSKEFGNILLLAVKKGYDIDAFINAWVNSTAEMNLSIPHNGLDGMGAEYLLQDAENWHGLSKVPKSIELCRFSDDSIFFIGFALRYGNIYLGKTIRELLDIISIDDLVSYDGTMTSQAWDEIMIWYNRSNEAKEEAKMKTKDRFVIRVSCKGGYGYVGYNADTSYYEIVPVGVEKVFSSVEVAKEVWDSACSQLQDHPGLYAGSFIDWSSAEICRIEYNSVEKLDIVE